MNVLHVPCYSTADPLPVLEKHIGELREYSSLSLCTTAQHLNRLDEVKEYLEGEGFRVSVGGQVLGCDVHGDIESDAVLYIGSGRFHPLALARTTEKPVYVLNPLSQVFEQVSVDEKKKWDKRRKGRLAKAVAARTFGILVSTKTGQCNIDKALSVKRTLEGQEKRAYIVAGDELTPANVLPFQVDCWVNTACPRMVDDDYETSVINTDDFDDIV